jgi:hypothetical protein
MYFSWETKEAEMLSGRVAQPEATALIARTNAIMFKVRITNLLLKNL